MKTVQLKLYGLVQGVGCRYRLERIAKELNVFGWTRNVGDSMVEVEVQGEEVDQFIQKVKKLPSPIRIDRIEEGRYDSEVIYDNFLIKPSTKYK